MISFGAAQTRFQNLSQDSSDGALTFFKASYNVGQSILEDELGSFYTEETYTDITESGVFSYPMPSDQFVRLKEAYVTISNVRYNLQQVHDETEWQLMMSQTTGNSSDILTHIFVRRDTFEVFPTPATGDGSTTGNTMTMIYEAGHKDLTADDYVDGTISDLANGDLDVTGSSTVFTAAMAGRYLKIDSFPAWYKIASYTSATAISLKTPYQGITISSGSETYVIGEMPRTPSGTHSIPIWYGLMDYYQGFKQNEDKAKYYRGLFEGELKRAKVTYKRRYVSNYIPGNRKRRVENPNHYPSNMTY